MLFVWAGALRAIRHRPSEGGESRSWWCLGGLLGFHAMSAFCLGAFLFTAEEMETIANLETGGAQFLEGTDTYEILPGDDSFDNRDEREPEKASPPPSKQTP